MIAVVAVVALMFAFALDIYPTVGKVVREQTSIRPKDFAYVHIPLVAFLTAAIVLPLLGAVTLVSKPATNGRAARPHAVSSPPLHWSPSVPGSPSFRWTG
jgi:hypothetical protein